jgi:hypothetical protein
MAVAILPAGEGGAGAAAVGGSEPDLLAVAIAVEIDSDDRVGDQRTVG